MIVLLSFLDRGNIGNAKIAGMQKDLDLTSDRYEWLLTIFYIAYILFQFQVCWYYAVLCHAIPRTFPLFPTTVPPEPIQPISLT